MVYRYRQKSIIGMQGTVLAVILCIFSIYLLFNQQYFPALFFLAISVPFFMLKKYTEFNPEKKTIHNYYAFLGLPLGSKKIIRDLKGIKIAKVKSSQTINSRVSSTNVRESGYGAFLFYDDTKVLLKFDENKNSIQQEMESLCKLHSIQLKS